MLLLALLQTARFRTGKIPLFPAGVDRLHSLCSPDQLGTVAGPGQMSCQGEGFCIRSASSACLALPADACRPAMGELSLLTPEGKKKIKYNSVNWQEFPGISPKLMLFGNGKVLSRPSPLKLSHNQWKEQQKQDQSCDGEKGDLSLYTFG